MKLSIFKQKRTIFILFAIIVLIALATIITVNLYTGKEDTSGEKDKPFYQALKIDGEYVSTELFAREGNKFFKLNKYNAKVNRMGDEERNDLFFNNVIERVVLEKYIEKNTTVAISDKEVDEYIKEKVKPFVHGSFEEYLATNSFADENDLKAEVKFFLNRLNFLPAIARDNGLELDDDELKRAESGSKTKDELLMNKFLASEEFKSWIEEIKNDFKIEILSPSILAYRYFKEGNYDKAAEYYEKSYEKSGSKIFLEKSKECREKIEG